MQCESDTHLTSANAAVTAVTTAVDASPHCRRVPLLLHCLRPPLALAVCSCIRPRGPSVVLRISVTASQALMLEISWPVRKIRKFLDRNEVNMLVGVDGWDGWDGGREDREDKCNPLISMTVGVDDSHPGSSAAHSTSKLMQ